MKRRLIRRLIAAGAAAALIISNCIAVFPSSTVYEVPDELMDGDLPAFYGELPDAMQYEETAADGIVSDQDDILFFDEDAGSAVFEDNTDTEIYFEDPADLTCDSDAAYFENTAEDPVFWYEEEDGYIPEDESDEFYAEDPEAEDIYADEEPEYPEESEETYSDEPLEWSSPEDETEYYDTESADALPEESVEISGAESEVEETEETWSTESEVEEMEETWSTASEVEEMEETWSTESEVEEMEETWSTESEAEEMEETWSTESEVEEMEETWSTASEVEDMAVIDSWVSSVEEVVDPYDEIFETESVMSVVEEIEEIEENPANEETDFTAYADGLTVRAHLDDPSVLPKGVEFIVTPVTPETDGYNYEAYLGALNENASEIVESTGDPNLLETAANQEESSEDLPLYTRDNTLLYDIAFMADRRAEDGSISPEGGKVEIEPEAGTVRFSFEFEEALLKESIDAENADAITLVHLPLTEEVRTQVDATSEAQNIGTSDVQIETITDGSINIGNGADTVEFSLGSLSVVSLTALKSIRLNGGNDWTGTTSWSLQQIKDRLGIAACFSVFANTFYNNNHMEGTIAVHELIGSKSQFGNTEKVEVATDTYALTVTKHVTGEPKAGSFRFGLFRKNGNDYVPTGDYITVKTDSEGFGQGVFSGFFGQDAEYYVFEVGPEGEILEQNGSYTEGETIYTVTYDSGQSISKSTINLGNTSYAEILSGEGQNLFNAGQDAVLIVGNENQVDPNGGSNGSALITNYRTSARYDAGANGTVIREEGEFPIDFNSEFANLRSLSSQLANATDGNGLKVANVKATGTHSFLEDMGRVWGIDPNDVQKPDKGGLGTVDEGQLLLINIDCTGLPSYYVNHFYINGAQSGGWNNASDRILFNFVQKNSSGGFEPYTGNIELDQVSGTVLIPSGSVMNANNTCGEVIANYAQHGEGEIHSRPIGGAVATGHVICENAASPATCSLKIWKTINEENAWSQDPEGVLAKKLDKLNFVIKGPDNYENKVYYRDFPNTLIGNAVDGREILIENLKPGTYTVTEYDGDIPGYKQEIIIRSNGDYSDNTFWQTKWNVTSEGSSAEEEISTGAVAKFWFDNRYTEYYPVVMPVTGSRGQLILMLLGSAIALAGIWMLLSGRRRKEAGVS